MIDHILVLMSLQYLNTPYKFGANGPYEFDCSGVTLRVMHDAGITLPDMSAAGLYMWAEKNTRQNYTGISAGDLLFFGSSNLDVTHVAIAINDKYMIEAGGSGRESLALSADELAKKDARVRIKPISNRRDFLAAFTLNI